MMFYDIVKNLFKKMNPVEWSKAQDLLVKLVQALAPLTVQEVPASLFLNKRFFIPQQWSAEVPLSKHPIRLLTILQKEVNNLVGEAPPKKEISKKEAPPVAKQAKQLIAEVQEAIGKLVNSEFIQAPKEAPLKEALKKLKPNLDQIIEAVTKEQESETEEEPSFRHPLPRPQREEGMKKSLPTPETPKRTPDVKRAVQEVKKETTSSTPEPLERREAPKKPRGEGRALEKKEPEVAAAPKEVVKPFSTPPKAVPIPPQGEPFVLPEEPEARPFPVEEVKALPAVPFVPQHKNLDPLRKKKKKRGFWFRKDREKENES